MAESTNRMDLQCQADIRLCRLYLWSNFEGLGLHLKQSSHPPHPLCAIESNSPAAASGLRVWDVILAANHQDMSNKNYDRVREAIKVACNTNGYVELLVVEEKYYKILKTEKIPIDSTLATVINAPSMMPADFANFPKLIPRICNMCLGRNNTEFGFKTVNGDNDIGVYIQIVFANSPASYAGLRKSDRIIEINDRNVDRHSSEYIHKKLDKANRKGMIKLFVADTQTYGHYIKNNMKFSLTELNKAIYSTTPQTVRNQKKNKKCIIKEDGDHHQTLDDKVSLKHSTIISNRSNNLLFSSENAPSKDKRQNDAKTKLNDGRYSSSGTLDRWKKGSIGRRWSQIVSSFRKNNAKHDSSDKAIGNYEDYNDNKSNYAASVGYAFQNTSKSQNDDFRSDSPVSVDDDYRSTSKFQNEDFRIDSPLYIDDDYRSTSKFQNEDFRIDSPLYIDDDYRSTSILQNEDFRGDSPVSVDDDYRSKSKFQNDDFRSNSPVTVDHRYSSKSKFRNYDIKSDYHATVSYGSGSLFKSPNNDTKLDYYSENVPKGPSLITSSTRVAGKSDYYHTAEDIFTSNAKYSTLRCQSLTDLSKSNQSTHSKPSVTTDVINVSNGTIRICRGDITKQTVDAIVVASTSDCLRENVLREAGNSIRAAYNNEKQRKTNKSICTNGGNLACKRIYFVPCPQMSQNADKWAFRTFVSEAIKIATNDRSIPIQSIAFPALGCGQYGCDSNFVSKTLIMAIAYELEHQPSLQLDIYFVIQQHQQKIFDAFRNELIALKNNGSTYRASQSSNIVKHLPPKTPVHHNIKKGFVVEKRLLDESSNEYTMAINEFSSTMTSQFYKEIVRVELVWNERWYKQYMIHKADFSQRLQNDTEKHLFHGCSESAANSIIKECFNRSYAGKHGTSYGNGVYFSSKASYSHSYTNPNTKGERCMFLAKVLIGKTTVGNSSMKICPAGYNTTTDGSHIYVIYHDAQAFGQYLITYK